MQGPSVTLLRLLFPLTSEAPLPHTLSYNHLILGAIRVLHCGIVSCMDYLFGLYNNSMREVQLLPHFTDEDTEAYEREVMCLRHNQW